jgi:hypothetical protein
MIVFCVMEGDIEIARKMGRRCRDGETEIAERMEIERKKKSTEE